MGNLICKCSQTSSLIDQRCCLSIISKCVSIPRLFVDVDGRYLRRWPTLTHTLALSLCLSGCLLSPLFFPFDIKTLFPDCLIIIEIQDFTVFGCSHFIGSTNTKVLDLHTLSLSLMPTMKKRELKEYAVQLTKFLIYKIALFFFSELHSISLYKSTYWFDTKISAAELVSSL